MSKAELVEAIRKLDDYEDADGYRALAEQALQRLDPLKVHTRSGSRTRSKRQRSRRYLEAGTLTRFWMKRRSGKSYAG